MENQKNPNPNPQKPLNSFVKYSGLAFQMIITLCLAAWGGMKLDAYFDVKTHLITVFLMLLAVVGSLYWLVKGLTRNDKG